MKILNCLFLLSLILCLSSCQSCKKDNLDDFEYKVEKSSSDANLVYIDYHSKIYGIDTNSFTVKVIISIKDMEIGGVAKLTDGGIVFTSRNNSKMYITDKGYNISKSIAICDGPMAPKVVNNYILIGSSMFESGAKFKFQIYNSNTYKLNKEFLFKDMIDAWNISSNKNLVYFGAGSYNNEYSQIYRLNLNNLDTISFMEKTDFFYNNAFQLYATDSILYVYSVLQKSFYKYDLNSGKFKDLIKLYEYNEFTSINARNLFHPLVRGKYLYGSGSFPKNKVIDWFVFKFNMETLKFEFFKELNIPEGYSSAANQYQIGNYLMIKVSEKLLIVDIDTGMIKSTVILN